MVAEACPHFPKVAGTALWRVWAHVALTYSPYRPLFTRQIRCCLQIPGACHGISSVVLLLAGPYARGKK